MKLIDVVFEDFINYKKPSMYLVFPTCDFKCDKECGRPVCQNSALAHMKPTDIDKEELIEAYLSNPISEAIVMAGLEPFDSPLDLIPFIDALRIRYKCKDDIVIYTGYTEDELKDDMSYNYICENYNNIIIKFGRYRPDEDSHFDNILGVRLASPNQYAKVINKRSFNE